MQTPFYYYDLNLLRTTLNVAQLSAQSHNFEIHYSVKANNENQILQDVFNSGMGADCVTIYEVQESLKQGVAKEKIVFAGVGKTYQELYLAIQLEIGFINVESIEELELIEEISLELNKSPKVCLRINPNIDANTHSYITTGTEENKFGISPETFPRLFAALNSLQRTQFSGLHFHIGSQITDLSKFSELAQKVNAIQEIFEQKGYSSDVINLGGGLGVNYENPDNESVVDFESYFQGIASNLVRRPGQRILFELGRSIVAQCGTLVSRVSYNKKGLSKNFLIIDAGLNTLIRPALYQASHKVETTISSEQTEVYDVVGPICESSDTFAKDLELPIMTRNNIQDKKSVQNSACLTSEQPFPFLKP